MSNTKHSAGYGNSVNTLHLPSHATGKILYDYFCEGDLPLMATTDFDVTDNGKPLYCSDKAYFNRMGNMCESDFDEGYNGRETQLSLNTKTDYVQVCQELKWSMKFARDQAVRMCENWDTYGEGAQRKINEWLISNTEEFGLVKIAASASVYNQGVTAGKVTQSLNLGSFTAPLSVDTIGAKEIMSRMLEVANETGIFCETQDLLFHINGKMYSSINKETSVLPYSDQANPFMKRLNMVPGWGYQVIGWSHNRSPYAGVNPNGQKVWYIMLVNPKDILFPFDLHYFEWTTIKHDIFLIGYATYGLKVFNSDSVVVAAVTI